MVPVTRLEPVRCCQRGILSPLRLPIPPHRYFHAERVYFSMSRLTILISAYLKKCINCGTTGTEYSLSLENGFAKSIFQVQILIFRRVQKCALFSFYQFFKRWRLTLSTVFLCFEKS